MRRAALAVAGLAALALAGPWLAPRDPVASADPVALRLLPPGSAVPCLVRLDGTPLPVAGRDDAGRVLTTWRVEGAEVVYRRGPRERRIALDQVQRGADGAPRTTTLHFALGTDGLGRDLAARLLAGARASLGIGLAGLAGAVLIALAIGLAAAGGHAASAWLFGAAIDGMLALPRVVVVMAAAALARPGPLALAALLALTGWPALARLTRAEARAAAADGAADAARAIGAGPLRIALRHILPRAAGTLLVAAAARVAPFVLLEASLSFLGFGIAPPAPSWGNVLADGRDVLVDAWWVATFPGLALVLAALAVQPPAGATAGRRGAARPAAATG